MAEVRPQRAAQRRLLAVACMTAAVVAVVTYSAIHSASKPSPAASSPGSTAQVVVARLPIAPRTRISEDMVELRSVRSDTRIGGAFDTVGAVVGRVAKFPLDPNQQIVATSLIDTSTASPDVLALLVPDGRRAVAIETSDVIGAGGLILPGDSVDVLWACCEDHDVAVRVLAQNVRVAAVDQALAANDAAVASAADTNSSTKTNDPDPNAITVTLFLAPQDIESVVLAEGVGEFRLALRGSGDDATADEPALLLTDLLPPGLLASLPEELRPDGYRNTPSGAAPGSGGSLTEGDD